MRSGKADLNKASEVFRRREYALRGGAVNDRSSYDARSVFELDALSAIGAIVNTRGGIRAFLRDPRARESRLIAIQRALVMRYFERLMVLTPSASGAFSVAAYSTREVDHSSEDRERQQPTASLCKPMDIALVGYVVARLLTDHPRDTQAPPQYELSPRQCADRLRDAKERALSMLHTWLLAQDWTTMLPQADFDELMRGAGAAGSDEGLKYARESILREASLLREFIATFMAKLEASGQYARLSSASAPILVTQTHIPETFVCDDFAMSARMQRALVEDARRQIGPHTQGEEQLVGRVVDLVDPSLWCQALGEKAGMAMSHEHDEPCAYRAFGHGGQTSSRTSRTSCGLQLACEHPRYQWVPTDVLVRAGRVVQLSIESDVNSIHPVAFPAFYAGLEHLLAGFVPLFERVLTSISTVAPPPPLFEAAPWLEETRDASSREGPGRSTPCSEAVSPHKQRGAPVRDHRVPFRPRAEHRVAPADAQGQTGELEAISLRGRRIQVITKISTIELTPEHSKFHGQADRAWHVEGDSGERLVAIGLYVLEAENVAGPEMSFRAFAHCPSESLVPGQTSEEAVHAAFFAFGEKIAGYHRGEYGRKVLQPWGSLALLEQRLFAVPAFLAHRLEPFELLDPSVSGRLTLVTFYLVDPMEAMQSSSGSRCCDSDRPRQWIEANIEMVAQSRRLPNELAQTITDFAARDQHSDLAQALGRRDALTQERARRNGIRFLRRELQLEQLRVTLPGGDGRA